jgi:hypothetical protein
LGGALGVASDLAFLTLEREKPESHAFRAFLPCRRRDSNPRHADYDRRLGPFCGLWADWRRLVVPSSVPIRYPLGADPVQRLADGSIVGSGGVLSALVRVAAGRSPSVSGHVLRVRRASGDRWVAHWRDIDGIQHKRVLARVWTERGLPRDGYLTKRGARCALDDILLEERRRVPGSAVRSRVPVTFEEASAEWLRYIREDRGRRGSTVRDYERVLRNLLLPVFGTVPIDAITARDIDRFRATLGRAHDQQVPRATALDLQARPARLRACGKYGRRRGAPADAAIWRVRRAHGG